MNALYLNVEYRRGVDLYIEAIGEELSQSRLVLSFDIRKLVEHGGIIRICGKIGKRLRMQTEAVADFALEQRGKPGIRLA